MIRPGIGRIVWFHDEVGAPTFAAIVCKVFDERTISVAVFDDEGSPFSWTHIPLLQDDDIPPASGPYCEWMPYQKGKAGEK